MRWPLNGDISITRPALVFPIDIRIIHYNGGEIADKREVMGYKGIRGVAQEIMIKDEGELGLDSRGA